MQGFLEPDNQALVTLDFGQPRTTKSSDIGVYKKALFASRIAVNLPRIMSTITEIESAIERLPAKEVEALAVWLETVRKRGVAKPAVEAWLNQARGAAQPRVSTADVMALTRGDE